MRQDRTTSYPVDLKSARWKKFRAERKTAAYNRCGVCGFDWRKQPGNYLALHHLRYDRANHEQNSDVIPLCKRHHPKGMYSRQQIKQDRQIYLTIKWTGIIILLPFRLIILLFRTSRRLWKRDRLKARAT